MAFMMAIAIANDCESFGDFLFFSFFFYSICTTLFIHAVLLSEFMTLDCFCQNVRYVVQYIPKRHNHQGTACFLTV